ncbi:hypothetical protein [Helicobacter heilmannii]|uniref:hypothetical protein n=1 Tax=Helicobacter heilmannii TaxID=35817 RepID=UPI00101B53B8|nr:hypothetical protein [Helicobacter heilmannii]
MFPLPPEKLSFWFNSESGCLYTLSPSEKARFEYDFKGEFWESFKSMEDFLTNTDFSEVAFVSELTTKEVKSLISKSKS